MFALFNWRPWLAGLLAVLIALGAGFIMGQRQAHKTAAAEKLAAVQRAIAQSERLQRENDAVASRFEQSRERIRIEYRTLREEARNDAETKSDLYDCGLDADGLRRWNAANAGLRPATASADSTMPDATTGTLRASGRP